MACGSVPAKPFQWTAKCSGNERLFSLAAQGDNPKKRRVKMRAAVSRLLPRASTKSVGKSGSLVPLVMFCALGLLLSLCVLILDQHISGDWF